MKIVWSPLALERLAEIALYIARDNPAAARRWIKQAFAKAAVLRCFPERGRSVPELHRFDIREIIYPPYRIIYRLRPTQIAILTVRHSKQRFEADSALREGIAPSGRGEGMSVEKFDKRMRTKHGISRK